MNKTELTKLVLDTILSRKDKYNKTTQLAMAINGTYVEDRIYVDDRLLWVEFTKNEETSVFHSSIKDIVAKINSNNIESVGSVGLFLTTEQADKFSIAAGYAGVSVLKDDNLIGYIEMFESIGVDVTDLAVAIEFVIEELDNNTKFTYNGVEYTLLPAEEEPVVTAPIFDSIDLIGTRHTASHFLLGDNMVFNETQETTLISPFTIFFTQEQRSKISMSVELNTNEYTQEELVSEIIMSTDNLGGAPFNVPENAAYILNIISLIIEMAQGNIISFTITYDGVDYVYDNTNVQIATPSEEAPIFNSLNVTGNLSDPTYEVTTFLLGDNADCYTGMIAPYALFLTAEQYSSISISTQGMSQEDQNEININEFFTSASDQVLSGAPFNIPSGTTQVLFLYELFSLVTTTRATSLTVTYNGVDYVYDSTNIASVAPL